MRIIKVYSFDGIELHDEDDLGMMKSGDYLFYSMSKTMPILNWFYLDEPFDYQVCMDQYEINHKLG